MRYIPRITIIISLLAMFAAGCVATRTTKSAGEQIDDSVLTAKVKSALAQDVGTGNSIRIDVETYRGKVQLNGFTDSADKKRAAAVSARRVEGVKDVENNLVVATSARTTGQFVDDSVITAKLKSALAADPNVAAHEVNLNVRQGVVQLSGFVDNAATKARAEEVAGGIAGVRSVQNQLDVKQR
jgi:hyperosmotically inducible periplasmic protein